MSLLPCFCRSVRAALGLALCGLAGWLGAQTQPSAPRPVETWSWGSSAQASLGIPLAGTPAGAGGSLGAGLFFTGLPDERFRWSLDGGYRFIPQGASDSLSLPFISLNAEYRFLLDGWLGIGPVLGASMDWIVREQGSQATGNAWLGGRAELHLGERAYLGMIARLGIPFDPQLPVQLDLGLSLRQAWALPVRAGGEGPEKLPSGGNAPGKAFSVYLGHDLPLFSPDGDGQNDRLRFSLAYTWLMRPARWELRVKDPTGVLFRYYGGTGAPPGQIIWEGSNSRGETVESAMDYSAELTVWDEAGQAYRDADSFSTDVLVLIEGERRRIRLPNIQFPADSVELVRLNTDTFVATNRKVLNRLVEIFKRFPDYSMTIEGHANAVQWRDPAAFRREQREELLPLSLSRAKAVKAALVALGIADARIAVVGKGGEVPLVPFADDENSWKNRRVEILLRR